MPPDPILTTALRSYLDQPPPPAPQPLSWTISNTLDRMLGFADRWDEHDLAGCLLILALCRRQPGGLDRCLVALRHVLAELSIDLPLPAVGSGQMAVGSEENTPHHIYTERS